MSVEHLPTAAASTSERAPLLQPEHRLAFILVTSLFFLWGLSYGLLDVLNKHFQETLHVTRAESGLLQMAYFGAYFVMALPAAALMNRWGYKAGMILGLGLFASGALLFIPASNIGRFDPFLFALFVIASGLACLETAANPYVTSLGAPETGPRRLNFSQSFNGLGSSIGPLIGGSLFFANSPVGGAQTSVQSTYVAIAAVVLLVAALMARTRMPDLRLQEKLIHTGDVQLLRQRHFVGGVVAQFFYVAAQVAVGAMFINFVTEHGGGIGNDRAAYLLAVANACFLAGRFSGTAVMGRFSPTRMLAVYGVINVVLCVAVVAALGTLSVLALIAVFFFMSIMFPTIFALAVRDLGAKTRRGASFVIMSIVGGALAPYAMGRIADRTSTALSFLLPAACFAVVAWYGYSTRSSTARTTDPAHAHSSHPESPPVSAGRRPAAGADRVG
jgi:FHS family L-fucose permease-like MFS transporter